MQRIKLALLIGNLDYRSRIAAHLLAHEKERFEMHLFSAVEQLEADLGQYDAVLCADCLQDAGVLAQKRREPFLYLIDQEDSQNLVQDQMERLHFIEKYQSMNGIIDEILGNIGTEIQQVQETGNIRRKTTLMSVYSLAENEYQLPFLVTLASVLGEQNRVLILDLQENSGFSHLIEEPGTYGMEDLLAMAESNHYNKSRLMACVGHMEQADYIYPVQNTECLCETSGQVYVRLLQMLMDELDYSIILLNLGSRFVGFFEVLNYCQQIYLMTKNGGLCQWREFEFMEEVSRRGYDNLSDRIAKIEIPILAVPTTCERLVEQWKWNELGDMIRHMIPQMPENKRMGA